MPKLAPWMAGLMLALSLGGCETLERLRMGGTSEQPVSSGGTQPSQPEVADQRNAERLLAQARDWQRKAASVDGEWRDVQTFIEQAEQAISRGEYARAIALAEQARFQAEMGYRQMKSQETVDNPPYLHF